MRLALTGCSGRLAQRLRSVLQGHELLEAAPGDPAAPFDVILVASGQGTIPGASTCAERVRVLRQHHPSLPILAVTNGACADAAIDVFITGFLPLAFMGFGGPLSA